MALPRFVVNFLLKARRIAILAMLFVAFLFIFPAGQTIQAGGLSYDECEGNCDVDTPPPPPPPPPKVSPVVEIEPGDREPDRRYWGIQQCCRRLIEGRPLRGTYCTR
ncbi:MAG: hypothetical protein ACTSUY_05535, partial [Alphaproteobacteria bacterium]